MQYKDGHPRTARNAWFCVELEDEKIAFVMPGHYFFCAFSNASGVPSMPVVIGSYSTCSQFCVELLPSPSCLKVLRLRPERRSCRLGDLSKEAMEGGPAVRVCSPMALQQTFSAQ